MALGGPGLELRVELHAQEPGVALQLYHLHQQAVGRDARDDHAVGAEGLAVVVVELVAVAVALEDDLFLVGLGRQAAGDQAAGIGPQAHGATLAVMPPVHNASLNFTS